MNTLVNIKTTQFNTNFVIYLHVMAYFETKLSSTHVGNEPIVVSNYT